MQRIEKTKSCWLWTGGTGRNGYGDVYFDGRMQKAHRIVYRIFKGPIPEGLVLDHLCRIRRCVNPDHLEPVTHRENTIRGIGFASVNHRKTTCPRGHLYDTKDKCGRRCLQCRREQQVKCIAKALAAAVTEARREAYLTAAKMTRCMTSQLPGFKGGCAANGVDPCMECFAAARLEGLAASVEKANTEIK